MTNIFVAIDQDPDSEESYIVGVSTSLNTLRDNIEFIAYEQIPLDWLDTGFYIDSNGEIQQINRI